jgi:hypothetical protein
LKQVIPGQIRENETRARFISGLDDPPIESAQGQDFLAHWGRVVATCIN